MEKYIGVKLVRGEPEVKDGVDGYQVVYADGYTSWCPKDSFEKQNLLMLGDGTVTEEDVHEFIQDFSIQKMGPKTTVVCATLKNGFVIVESSSCVDPDNYDQEIGASICMNRIHNKIWELLGFLLQCGERGFSGN